MIVMLFTLLSLCPVLDTGRFYFKEFIHNSTEVDTFYGDVYVSPKKSIKINVIHPDTELWLFRSDSIYMIMGSDTQSFYKKGLVKLLFEGIKSDSLLNIKKTDCGCNIFSKDTTNADTLFIFGRTHMDSIYFINRDTKVRFYLGRKK